VELLDFPGIGTLEAFNTDGLRTLLHTIAAPNMKEKTLRYPGHVEKMLLLRESGFFSEEPMQVDGHEISPLAVTGKLLFPRWQLGPDEGDITVMQITVTGHCDGERVTYRYDLLDRWDRATGTTSMARTTGYTATGTLRLVAAGLYDRPGISPPEYLGRQPGCVPFLLDRLRERGVVYRESVLPG
jgi:saccharopine dehydrogenase-like NADP-dependent oxidoreductase